jgi:hypothetical protein
LTLFEFAWYSLPNRGLRWKRRIAGVSGADDAAINDITATTHPPREVDS